MRLFRTAAAGLSLAALCLGCLIPSESGDRAAEGFCPEGEICSEAAPEGLLFVNLFSFDLENAGGALQPVILGGEYKLGFILGGSGELPALALEIEDPSIVTGRVGTGDFGSGHDDTSRAFEVDGYVVLNGQSEGTTTVRIREAGTGALLDQVDIDVHALGEVEVVASHGGERDYLIAGCEDRVGVRLFADPDDPAPDRAFDSGLSLRGDIAITRDSTTWDAFFVSVPSDQGEASFEVAVAGQTFARTLPIRTLDETRFDECP